MVVLCVICVWVASWVFRLGDEFRVLYFSFPLFGLGTVAIFWFGL